MGRRGRVPVGLLSVATLRGAYRYGEGARRAGPEGQRAGNGCDGGAAGGDQR